MNRSEYHKALSTLPLQNPSIETASEVLPHLSRAEIDKILSSQMEYIASPPLYVRGTVQCIFFSNERIRPKKIDPSAFHYAGAKSVYRPEEPHHKYIEKALGFANTNWGNDMILNDGCKAFVRFNIENPSESNDGGQAIKKTVYAAVKRRMKEIFDDSDPKDKRRALNDAIVRMTTDSFIAAELGAGLQPYNFLNCAFDGAPLDSDRCTECGRSFDKTGLYANFMTQLPSKIVRQLEQEGIVFKHS